MKYKKYSYLVLLILMLMVGIDSAYAKKIETCNYLSDSSIAMARLEITSGYGTAWTHGGKDYSKVYVQKLGNKVDNDTEKILNWYSNHTDKDTGTFFEAMYNGSSEANINPVCPTYLIVRTNNKYSNYKTFATDSISIAQKFVEASNSTGEYKTWYMKFQNSDGSKITDEQYYSGFVTNDTIIDKDAEITCTQLLGDKNDDGEKYDPDKNESPSIYYILNTVLQYVRIIVPILIIVLGLLDLGKAVIASKEDEMKKAQTTFVKRLIIGLAVFFVPLLVDIVMWLADIVWEGLGYSVCEFK